MSSIICLGKHLCLLNINLISWQTCSFFFLFTENICSTCSALFYTSKSTSLGNKTTLSDKTAPVGAVVSENENETCPESFAVASVMSLRQSCTKGREDLIGWIKSIINLQASNNASILFLQQRGGVQIRLRGRSMSCSDAALTVKSPFKEELQDFWCPRSQPLIHTLCFMREKTTLIHTSWNICDVYNQTA